MQVALRSLRRTKNPHQSRFGAKIKPWEASEPSCQASSKTIARKTVATSWFEASGLAGLIASSTSVLRTLMQSPNDLKTPSRC
jgi:hypothetical protein